MTRPSRHVPTRRRAALALAALLALCAGACGGEEAPPAAGAGDAEQAAARPKSPAEARGSAAAPELGEPRDDLERFHGVYALPERPGRGWFVAPARRPPMSEAPPIPPGYLMLGAMFGDVAPWPLRSRSETAFVQAWVSPGQEEPVAIAFETDADGRATALRFTQGSMKDAGRLERIDALPEAYRRTE